MFAVGHIALGYLAGRITGKITDHIPNIQFIWTIALAPDIDFLIPGVQHRGPTHSLILAIILATPFLLKRPRETAPYFAALATHAAGDYITKGGAQILWPLSKNWYQFTRALCMSSPLEVQIELSLFAVLTAAIIATRDYKRLLDTDYKNSILVIPLATIVFPATFRYPISIPQILILPHLILLSIITISITISIVKIPKALSVQASD